MDDDPTEFDFGSWCLVCGRLISPPQSLAASASSSPAHSPSLSAKEPAKPARKASVKRTKSSSKLHGHGHGHARSKSGTRLNALGGGGGLAPSTQIHKVKSTTTTTKASVTETSEELQQQDGTGSGHSTPPAPATEELSSLYCSLECQRIDLAGGGGGAGQAGGGALSTAKSPSLFRRPPPDPRRHSSSSSINSQPLHSPSSFSPTLSDGLPGGLDFSNRRNSRGATYRPLAMSRTLSGGVEGGAGTLSGVNRNRSSGSLNGLGEDYNGTGAFARPLSSLSSFRGMTPLPPSPGLPPHSPTFARPSGGRSKSDMPAPVTRFALDGEESPQRERIRGRHGHEGETPEEREQRKREKRERSKARREAGLGSGRGTSYGPVHGSSRRERDMMAQSVPASLGLGLEELHLQNRPPLPAPIPQRPPNRSSSSASLALMGSSFSSRSYDARMHSSGCSSHKPQATLGRSESTASLSGLTAHGTILPPSAGGVGDVSSPSTFIPPLPRPPLYSPTHPRSSLSIPTPPGAESSSPSSAASTSFTNSHHSASQSGTSHSSHYLSSSAGSGTHTHSHSHAAAGGRERGRTTRGLQMTASSASLAAKGGGGGERSHSRADKSRTPRSHIQPPPPDRAASTPAATHRPSIYQTAPTPSPRRPSSSHSHASTSPNAVRPSALQTPSLSYLAAESASAVTGDKGPRRNFSWDQLGVKAYHSLDLDEVRAAKASAENGGRGEKDGEKAGTGAAGQAKARRSKAKLFHFAMDDDE